MRRILLAVILGIVLAAAFIFWRNYGCLRLHRLSTVIQTLERNNLLADPDVQLAAQAAQQAYTHPPTCVKRAETCHTVFTVTRPPHNSDTVVIAFAGSQNTKNWLTNTLAFLQPFFDTQAKVHAGAFLAYTPVRQQVLDAAKDAKRVLVTGHSLGAMLAQLAAVDIANQNADQNPAPEIANITFSTPPVGDAAFAALYKQKVFHKAEHFVVAGDPFHHIDFWKSRRDKYQDVHGLRVLPTGKPHSLLSACN